MADEKKPSGGADRPVELEKTVVDAAPKGDSGKQGKVLSWDESATGDRGMSDTSKPSWNEGSKTTSEGVAVASLVLGVLSCMTFFLFPVCAAFGAVSVFLGRLYLHRLAKKQARASAKGWANAGIVLSIAGVVLSLATYGACVVISQRWASEGKREHSKAIEELEKDPDFEKDVKELREELDKLDEKLPE